MKLKSVFVFAALLLASAQGFAKDWQVCWQPPTQFENGDPLLEQDLAYYTLYVNDAELVSFDVIVGTWCYIITINTEGTYIADMTVTHTNGATSARSNQAVFTLGPRTPGAPTNVTVVEL